MRESRTYGSTGRGSETGHGDDYTGTKPETADTDKSEPTGTAPTPDPTNPSLGDPLKCLELTAHADAVRAAGTQPRPGRAGSSVPPRTGSESPRGTRGQPRDLRIPPGAP